MKIKLKELLFILGLIVLLGIAQAQDNPQDDTTTEETNPNDNTNPQNTGQSDSNNDDDDDDNGDNQEQPKQDDNLESKEIKVGEYYHINKNITFNDKYQLAGLFYFKISEKVQNKDLFIMVRGREDFTHNPILIYSKSNKTPDLTQQSDISCGLTGHDFCIINNEDIAKGQIYYIGVHCIKSCKFDLYVQYDQKYQLELEEQTIYESPSDTPYVLEIQITFPQNLNENIEHVLIESYILNFNEVQSNFHMYVNKGTTIPNGSTYDYVTEELKLNGQSILLQRDVDNFAPGAVYSIAIEVPAKAKMLVRSESFEKIRPVSFYRSVDDMVKKGQLRIFMLEISVATLFEWDKEELSFDLEPYFGNPDLYVSHDTLPKDPTNLSSYRWSSTEQDGLESLTLTKGSIENKSLTGEKFYIAVYGETAASFRLLTYSSTFLQRQLIFNCVENGYSTHNEIIGYQLYLADEEDSDISIHLTTLQGDAQLFIKRCFTLKIEECFITLDDTKNENLKEPNFYKSVEASKDHKIEFKYKKNECVKENGVNMCQYIVGVLGNSKGQSKYRLLAKHSITPIILRENEEHRYFLLEGDKDYYKFTLNIDDQTISKVEFSITSISGEFIAYASRTHMYPSQSNHDKQENAEEDVIVYSKSHKNPNMKGTYYLGIQAVSGCIYSIYVKVYRSQKHGDDGVLSNMKQIELGDVQRGYLQYNAPIQYYFTVNSTQLTNDHQTNIILYYNAYLNETIPYIEIDPDIQIAYHVNKTVVAVERAQEDYISSDFVYMKIFTNHKDNGKYVITLTHKSAVRKDYKIKYQLNVNENNIIYIVPRGAYIQDIGSSEVQENYELYLYEPSKVYLEVFECFGKVKIEAASTIEKIESRNFDIKSNSPARFIGDHTIVNYQKNEKGPIYFSVSATTPLSTTNNIKALYMIVPHILPQKSVTPHDIFGTPADGQISTEVTFTYDSNLDEYISNVEVKYGAIECANDCVDQIYKPLGYSYFIYITNKDDYMQYFAKCDLNSATLKSLGFNDTDIYFHKSYKTYNNITHTQSRLSESYSRLKNGTYYIEIMGIVYLETNYSKKIQEPFTFIYPMKSFQVGDINNNNNDNPTQIKEIEKDNYIIPLYLMIPLGIALLALILICIYKQIKTFIIRRRYRIAMMMQEEKNPELQEADKDQDINDDDEKQKKKKVDKINFLN